jgi:uncharacterized protein (DUF2252 family)
MEDRAKFLSKEIFRIDGVHPGSGLAKHQKMCISPFVFFRGSAQLFYADLALGHLSVPVSFNNIPLTAIMGDCHTSNFGFLTEDGSHSNSVIFSPNDFDDACIGHAEWDLLRFCTSLVLCADHCRGLQAGLYISTKELLDKPVVSDKQVNEAIIEFLSAYLSTCEKSIQSDNHFAMAVTNVDSGATLRKRYLKALQRSNGGELFETKSALAKSTDIKPNGLFFKINPDKFIVLSSSLKKQLIDMFSPYMDDTVLDVVERANAGTGSVNMLRYYFLVGPKIFQGKTDLPLCHIVEVKQQREAAPIYYFCDLSPVNRLNPAHLTVVCQRRMQRSPDLVLDEVVYKSKHWLVRSRHHAKVGFDPEDIAMGNANVNKEGFVSYAKHCGQAMALAHCRGDRRSTRFEQAVCAALPLVRNEVTKIAQNYANTVKEDFLCFKAIEEKT